MGWPYKVFGYLDHEDPYALIADHIHAQLTDPKVWALETGNLTLDRFTALKQQFPAAHFDKDLSPYIQQLRLVKTADELEKLNIAGKWAPYKVFGYLDHEDPYALIADHIHAQLTDPKVWALETGNLTLDRFTALKQQFPAAHFDKDLSPYIQQLRLVKTADELEKLNIAGKWADFALGWPYKVFGYLDHEDPYALIADHIHAQLTDPKVWALETGNLTLDRFTALKQQFPAAHFDKDLSPYIQQLRHPHGNRTNII
ncbi:hypothetical protein WP50_13265 [Lactiplantibacillus plantarum]|nr:hypothetical protein WP50_13265 [Lactiplantibacillus plantarum]